MWIKIDGTIQKVISRKEFDFKNSLQPGDKVTYINEIRGEKMIIDGEKCLVTTGIVQKVYDKFCLVDNGIRVVTVNWWNILRLKKGNFSSMQMYQEMLKKID